MRPTPINSQVPLPACVSATDSIAAAASAALFPSKDADVRLAPPAETRATAAPRTNATTTHTDGFQLFIVSSLSASCCQSMCFERNAGLAYGLMRYIACAACNRTRHWVPLACAQRNRHVTYYDL